MNLKIIALIAATMLAAQAYAADVQYTKTGDPRMVLTLAESGQATISMAGSVLMNLGSFSAQPGATSFTINPPEGDLCPRVSVELDQENSRAVLQNIFDGVSSYRACPGMQYIDGEYVRKQE